MNDKETIKNKFTNFEPEVNDFVINQNWEKIKYFVPQKEKKRRGAMFFLYGTLAFLLITSAFFIKPLITENSLTEKEIVAIQKDEPVAGKKTIAPAKTSNTELIVQHQKEKNNSTSNSNNISQKIVLASASKPVYKKGISPTRSKEKNESNEAVFVKTINEVDSASVVYDKLPLLPSLLLIPEKNAEITSPSNPNYYLPKPISPISVDLFAGVQPVQTLVKQPITDQKNNTVSYMAGVAINHHFRNKFTFSGQFIYSKNNFNYKNTVAENKIVNQSISVSSTPMTFGDTVKYIQANTNYIIRSNESYNFAIGAEYKILQKNKLSLSAMTLFNVTATKYNYGYTRNYGKDVLVYIKGDPAPHPSKNLASSTFKEGDYMKEETQINTGIMPGILLGYRLNDKTSIIFKPACFIPFSETKLVINSTAFKLKENSLLLNVGLRINL